MNIFVLNRVRVLGILTFEMPKFLKILKVEFEIQPFRPGFEFGLASLKPNFFWDALSEQRLYQFDTTSVSF